ncbi:MAG: hypothetical protein R3F54_28760 [Alphaproteobacteria bacterium]
MSDGAIVYRPSGPTTRRFHLSKARRRLIVGPIRSGTSVALCNELMRQMMECPAVNGVRRSRYAVLRKTFGDLKRTTIKTWVDWSLPLFKTEPVQRVEGIIHDVDIMLPDGTRVVSEVNFFSMAKEAHISRLLSLELTGGVINEARDLPKAVVDAFDDRIGHFPAKRDGGEGYRFWLAGDTNPPDQDHWIYEMFEENETPAGWEYFRQPGALIRDGRGGWKINPKAENLQNLNGGAQFYLDAMQGKSEAHIAVYYGGEYGYAEEGKRIVSDYNDAVHCASEPLDYDLSVPELYIGIDFGATPAATIRQVMPNGQYRTIEELNAEKFGIGAFAANVLKPRLQRLHAMGFNPENMVITGDPAGSGTSQTDGKAPFQILADEGIKCDPAFTNSFAMRTEIINRVCRQMVDGQPRYLISPKCKVLRKGLAQKYVLKKVGVSTDEGTKYQTLPDKNEWSHVVEGDTYGLMGTGEGRDIGKTTGSGPIQYKNRRVA